MRNEHVYKVLTKFAAQTKNLLGNKLDAVILYGSFARDDDAEGSDVDVLVLVNMPSEKIPSIRKSMHDIAFDVGWDSGLLLSVIIENTDIYHTFKDASGFFNNVTKEGVSIVA